MIQRISLGNTASGALPADILNLIRNGRIAEFVTTSAAGVPIDTPALYFPNADLSSLDIATGLAYPAKAERARKRPKVGMLIEGRAGEPVILIAGLAAVRDQNLQANTDRYLAETGQILPGDPDWTLARKAVWYWTRIIIEITPRRVLWWPGADRMSESPQRWDSPDGTIYPTSDPAPPGEISTPPAWKQLPWQELATQALQRTQSAHLSLIDPEGYPLPFRVHSIVRSNDGFVMALPHALSYAVSGKTTLSFGGLETFLGDIVADGRTVRMRVERALPQLPTMTDMKNLWQPDADVYANLMARLRHETQRRGQPIPEVPLVRPEPTEGYRIRLERQRSAPSRGN